MAISAFLAKLLGTLFIVLAVTHLSHPKHLRKLLKDFAKTPSLIYFTGITLLIMGLLMVLVHNVWVVDWTLIITVLAWIVFLKGALFLLAPEWVTREMKHMKSYQKIMTPAMILYLLLGAYLLYLGFTAV